jgi:DNA-directed RNA polymerase subunit beta
LSVVSESDGVVKKVEKDKIVVQNKDGIDFEHDLYNNFYTNQKAVLNHYPLVKVGDKVAGGDILADSNSTKNGVWAPGVNLRVAYMPYKGKNYEDGLVISESASKKLTSEHLHKHESIVGENDITDKRRYASFFPGMFTAEQLEKIDDNGIAKQGTVVNYGDPVIIKAKKKNIRPEDIVLGKVSGKFDKPFSDDSEVWKYKFPGEVVRSVDGKTKVVRIRTNEQAVVGDKMSGRHGNKGIIVDILPDNEMPSDNEGNPVDIVLNPQGVIGRINPSQVLETTLGKVAKHRGKPFLVENFHSGNVNHEYVLNQLKEYGLEEKEELFDGSGGKSLGKIMTGYQTMLKLDHPVRKKFGARGVGPSYTGDMQPGRGDGGGQSIGSMELYGLLAHGAKENLFEMSTVKADRNDDFWYKLQSGQPYTMPRKVPFVTQKLFDYMKVLGTDLKRQGQHVVAQPMLPGEIRKMSNGEVKNGRILKSKDSLDIAESGGLFDPRIFGGQGIDGKKWGHVNLAKKMPNPLFEDAIKGVLGLTEPQFSGLLSGEQYLDEDGVVKKFDVQE